MIMLHYKEGGVSDNEGCFQLLMLKLIAKMILFSFWKGRSINYDAGGSTRNCNGLKLFSSECLQKMHAELKLQKFFIFCQYWPIVYYLLYWKYAFFLLWELQGNLESITAVLLLCAPVEMSLLELILLEKGVLSFWEKRERNGS